MAEISARTVHAGIVGPGDPRALLFHAIVFGFFSNGNFFGICVQLAWYVIAAAFSHIEMEGRMGNEPVSAGAFTNIFRISAIFDGIYGLGLFLAPKILFSMSQDPGFPAHPGWVRWARGHR